MKPHQSHFKIQRHDSTVIDPFVVISNILSFGNRTSGAAYNELQYLTNTNIHNPDVLTKILVNTLIDLVACRCKLNVSMSCLFEFESPLTGQTPLGRHDRH